MLRLCAERFSDPPVGGAAQQHPEQEAAERDGARDQEQVDLDVGIQDTGAPRGRYPHERLRMQCPFPDPETRQQLQNFERKSHRASVRWRRMFVPLTRIVTVGRAGSGRRL